MSELRPCPFCGSSNVAEVDTQAVCQNCHAINGDPFDYDYPRIEEWNTRPIEDALTARIAELEQENARLREENNKLQEWYDEMTNSEIRGEL